MRSDEQGLDDMREACTLIAALVARGRPAFDEDIVILPALERGLEVLGEAANHVSDAARGAFPNIPWPHVTRLRILLAHHYHRVEPDQVWTIATDEVPTVARTLGPIRDDGE